MPNLRLPVKILLASFFLTLLAIPAYGQTLHVIPGADTAHRAIGRTAERTQGYLLSRLLRIPQAQIKITTLRQPPSGDALLEAVKKLQIGQDDSIFVYYFGHGYYIPQRGHVLKYDNGEVERRLIEDSLKQHRDKARFVGLISDACAAFEVAGTAPNSPQILGLEGPQTTVPVGLERLFFRTKGFVNVNSTKWGQVALANYRMGDEISDKSPFSEAFADALERYEGSKDVDWNTLVGDVGQTTRARFLDTFPAGRTLAGKDGGDLQRIQVPEVIERLPGVDDTPVKDAPVFWPAPAALAQADVAAWTQAIRELQNGAASTTSRVAAALRLAGLCKSAGEAEGAQFFAECGTLVAVCGAVTNRVGPDDVAAIKDTYHETQALFENRIKDVLGGMTTSQSLYKPVLVPGRFCPDRTRCQLIPVEVKTLVDSKGQ